MTLTDPFSKSQEEQYRAYQYDQSVANGANGRVSDLIGDGDVLFLLLLDEQGSVLGLFLILNRFVKPPVLHVVGLELAEGSFLEDFGLVFDQSLEVFGVFVVVDFDEGGDGDLEDLVGVSREGREGPSSATVADLSIAAFNPLALVQANVHRPLKLDVS